METIQQQLNSLQTSVKRQRLLNIALLGVIVAGGFIAAVRYDSTPQQSSGDVPEVVKVPPKPAAPIAPGTTTVEADKLHRTGVEVLRCRELSIVDDAGRECIKMAKSVDGGADIRLLGKNGKTTLLVETKDDGSTDIKMFDNEGNTKFYEGIKPDGTVVNTTKLTEEEREFLMKAKKAM